MQEQTLTEQLRIGGALVISRTGPSNRAQLAAGLESAGYKKFVPEERTAFSALQGALQLVYSHYPSADKILIRPLKDKQGFAVVREKRGDKDDGNSYESLLTVTVPDDETHTPIKMFGQYGVEDYEAVVEQYHVCKNIVSSSAVSRCLDRIIESFDGVDLTAGKRRLSDKAKAAAAGGTKALWWLAKWKIEPFREVASIVETAGIPKSDDPDGPKESPNRVHVISCVADDDMIRAVGDGLTTEITNDVSAIEHEIETCELTTRQMANRRNKSEAMRKKLERYESSFNVYLTRLHEALDRVDQATAVATLLESGAAQQETPELALV